MNQMTLGEETIKLLCNRYETVKAPAKINLTFDIIGKLDNGYHEIRSIMHPITLFDEVTVGLTESKCGIIKVFCDRPGIPLDERNLCSKAAIAFFGALNKENPGVAIYIKKRIPDQAGMGGGSSDAAATLVILNSLYRNPLTQEELIKIASKIGADVPFFIYGKSALVKGFGEIISEAPQMPDCFLAIVKPEENSSTVEAFKKIDFLPQIYHIEENQIIDALNKKDLSLVGSKLKNVFEQAKMFRSTTRIQEVFLNFGSKGTLLSGSGSAVFGLFEQEDQARKALETFEVRGWETFLCKPYK